jgi:dienelactone hydrolase
MIVAALLMAISAGACAATDPSTQTIRIPLANARAIGVEAGMVAGVFRPPGDGPFPVVVYSHGRSAPDERKLTSVPDPRGFVRYWVRKGFAVVAPVRPGYGETGGADREDSGIYYDIFGNCWGQPAFGQAAAVASEAIAGAITWVRAQPWADRNRIVLVGTSMGALASAAAAADNPDGVAAYVNFAGGTGGNGHARPEHSCGSEEMAALMGAYGARTRVPSLWLYAENDSFWGAERPRAWHRAFTNRGGNARFVMTEGLRNADGHQLLGRGSRFWISHVDRFLSDLGF